MDNLRFYVLFNSISVISGRWAGNKERLCVMDPRLRFTRYPSQAGIKHVSAIATGQRLTTELPGLLKTQKAFTSAVYIETLFRQMQRRLTRAKTGLEPMEKRENPCLTLTNIHRTPKFISAFRPSYYPSESEIRFNLNNETGLLLGFMVDQVALSLHIYSCALHVSFCGALVAHWVKHWSARV